MSTAADDDDPSVEAMAAEVARKMGEAPMELRIRPLRVLHLAGALQLASRHPHLPATHAVAVQAFLDAVRQYFADCPTVLEILRRGDDAEYDRSPTTRRSD